MAVAGDVYDGIFVLSFFPRDVLDEIWDLIESVSEGFPTYSCLWIGSVRYGLNVIIWCIFPT